MAERFDPYYKWLGIPPKDQPPSHYRLLGLELFEGDPEVIDRAANRLMDYLHGISDGEHLAQAQTLLNEISAARLCLLDDAERAKYDERLRAQGVGKPAAGEVARRGDASAEPDGDDSGERAARTVRGQRPRRAAPPAAPPPAPFVPSAPPVQRRGAGSSDAPVRAKKSATPVLIGLAACVIVLGGLSVWLVLRSGPQKAGAPGRSDALARSRGQKETRRFDSSPTIVEPRPSTALESGKTEIDSFPLEPAKTFDPPTFPPPKEEAPKEPRPETADLFEAAKQAVKLKNAKEALELLEKYCRDPAAPQADEAAKWLFLLRDISSDEEVLRQMERFSNEELLQVEAGQLKFRNSRVAELDDLFNDAVRRNIPEAKRRRGMVAEAPQPKGKVPPDKTASDPPTPNPTTPDVTAPVPDPLTKPMEFLVSQGLSKHGLQWQLNEDAALTAMSGVVDVEKKYTPAAAKFAKELKAFNQVRAQYSQAVQQEDAAKQQNRKPAPQVVQFLNEWRPKIGSDVALSNYAELRTMLLARNSPHSDLLVAVIKAHKAVTPVDQKYTVLANDSRVAEALGKLPGEKVGPSAKYSQARAKLAKTEALVLIDEVPIYLKDREAVLSTLVGDTPTDLTHLPRQNFNVITEALVKKLGIAVPADAPAANIERMNINGEKQIVPGRVITIASIRLGKHVLSNVQFIMTGPAGADMGSGLGSSAFGGLRTEVDRDNFVFKVRPQDAPEPEPKGKKRAAR